MNTDKRQQERLPACPLAPSGPPGASPYRILDISHSGCLVESTRPLGRVGSILSLELPVPARQDASVARATIVWERVGPDRPGQGPVRYGLSFRDMDKESQEALDRYLDYLKQEHHIRQLDAAWRRIRTPRRDHAPPMAEEEPESLDTPASDGPFKGRNDSGNAFVR